MQINEMFLSQQGEGPQVGMLAWFIRFSGCNLSCSWCDSKYAKDGKEMNIESIIDALNISCNNVILTGGEPLIQKDILNLMTSLGNFNIYVETNGTIYDQHFIGMAKYIVSPKPEFLNTKYLESLRKWTQHATFKFVVETKQEFDEAVHLCDVLDKHEDVYIMPKGIDDASIKKNMLQIAGWIKKEAPFIWLSPRMQIYLWGNKRGK